MLDAATLTVLLCCALLVVARISPIWCTIRSMATARNTIKQQEQNENNNKKKKIVTQEIQLTEMTEKQVGGRNVDRHIVLI